MDKWTQETWLDATLVEAYEDSEDVTLPAAQALIDNVMLSLDRPLSVLDIGAGMGQVTSTLLAQGVSRTIDVMITCGDIDQGILAALEEKKAASSWSNVQVKYMDATNMVNVKDNAYDHVIGNFLYFLTADPMAALRETFRTLLPGGTIAFTTWSLSGPFALLQYAQAHMADYPLAPPNARLLGTWNHPRFVRSQLEQVGYTDIKVTPFPFVQQAKSPKDMARKMRHVIMLHTMGWGHERRNKGWELGQTIEQVLERQQGSREVAIHSVVLLITAKKPF